MKDNWSDKFGSISKIMNKTKVAIIGGGTGSSVVISGLKKFIDLDLSILVNMTDDGGSNKVVRDDFGMLPLSDVRKSILALVDESKHELLREIFTYRFAKSEGLAGHTLGNLIMMALTDSTGSELLTIEKLCQLFEIQHKVIPVTSRIASLNAIYADGTSSNSEHEIDEKDTTSRITKLTLKPNVSASKEALEAIEQSEYILLGPGDLYTTTIAALAVKGMKKAISNSNAKVILVSNLFSKKGQTKGLELSDFVNEIEKYIGKRLFKVIHNDSIVPRSLRKRYEDVGEHMIENDMLEDHRVELKDVASTKMVIKSKGDKLRRSLFRHDSDKLAVVLYSIFKGVLK